VDTHEYKKIDRYPMNMDTDTGRIFILRVWYGRATICTLPALLTSLAIIS